MQVLSFPFDLLSFCGVWLPAKWESEKYRRILYLIYSSLSICTNCIMVLLEIVLLFNMSNFEMNFLLDILFTLLTAISYCIKAMNFIVRRKNIIKLKKMLLHRYCLPCDLEEIRMEKDLNSFIRLFTIVFNVLAQATLFCLLMTPVFQKCSDRELPFRVWLPFDLRVGRNFWFSWACEICPLILGILINVTTDVLVSGFILQACKQLDFLRRRLRRLQYHHEDTENFDRDHERGIINQAILHHRHIIQFLKEVTETFEVIIIEQFVASALILSAIVYELALGNLLLKLQKIMAVGYLMCMLFELFCYCWFGNEISLKSVELGNDIYKLDWTVLSNESKKTLMFIMFRTSRPITMCYGSVIILNVDSFKNILKITYSVVNVLKEYSAN